MTQLFDLNARIQQLTWSLIFYEKYSTSLSTIVLVVLTTVNFGGFSNFCRYYTRSQVGKSTGYRPTLKPLLLCFFGLRNFETIHHALCHHNSSHMLNEMFVQLSIFREPNMKMCSLVVYPGPLRFSRVMSVWTWKFDTIHRALCHHNSSHMLNEMFGKLSILQDPNMKMCTLVVYPGPLSFSKVMPKTMHLYILRF
jgi:hypothetical protein